MCSYAVMSSIKEQIDTQVIDQSSYSGQGTVGGPTAVFGGQVIGQALTSAIKSIGDLDSDFLLHSFHCYFVCPTPYDQDILYRVQRTKEGKRFCSLTVDATLASGRTTFKCMVSFNKPEPDGDLLNLTTRKMPIVPHPDRPDVPVMCDRRHLVDYRQFASAPIPVFDVQLCFSAKELEELKARRPMEPKLVMWIRWKSGYSPEDHQNFHRSAVASASDLMLARSVTKAFPQFDQTNLYVTSLDHSIWFHTHCDSREWHLHVAECDHSKGGQALTSLWIYKEDGTLVATGKQESLCRPKL